MSATLSLLLTGICLGDQLDVGGAKYNGTFDAYDTAFHFTTGSGKKRTEKPARVKALSLEEPIEVTFKVRNDRSEYKGMLKGYEFSNFLLEIEGKDVSVHSSVILSMTPHREEAPPPPPPPPEKKPEVVEKIEHRPPPTKPRSVEIPREARDSQRYPIPKVNTESLASRDLSKEQRLALESFIAAKAGYDADTARDGCEAIDTVRARDVDLVIADLKMPGADGLSLLDTVRELRPASKVILMSAYGADGGQVDALARGAYAYLNKPVSRKVLLDLCEKACGDASECVARTHEAR